MAARDFALMLMVCVFWAANTIIGKLVLSDLGAPPLFYAFARFAVVAAICAPFLFPMPRPRWRLLAVGVMMGAGNFALMFVGLKDATPSSASIVGQLGVPMTTLLSVLVLREKISLRRGLGIVMTFAGAMTVMWNPHGLALSQGLLFVAGSAATGAVGAVLIKQMPAVKPLKLQAWVGLTSVAVLGPLSLVFETGHAAVLPSLWFWAAVVFSAAVVSVGAHTTYYHLIQRYDANLVAPLTLMGPLLTIVFGVIITHDPFGPRLALGALLALAGVLVIAFRPNRMLTWLTQMRARA